MRRGSLKSSFIGVAFGAVAHQHYQLSSSHSVTIKSPSMSATRTEGVETCILRRARCAVVTIFCHLPRLRRLIPLCPASFGAFCANERNIQNHITHFSLSPLPRHFFPRLLTLRRHNVHQLLTFTANVKNLAKGSCIWQDAEPFSTTPILPGLIGVFFTSSSPPPPRPPCILTLEPTVRYDLMSSFLATWCRLSWTSTLLALPSYFTASRVWRPFGHDALR